MPEKEPLVVVDGHPVEESWISNVVRVGIYGGDFNSIQEAINYCVTQTPTAASRWAVKVYPGTYTENIIMAQYVDVVGEEKNSVIIPVTNGTAVTMADDTRIANLTINALATAAGSAYGIELNDATCRVEDINMYIDRDVTGGLECVGILENVGAAAKNIYIRNVRIRCEQVVNTNTHGVSIRQANKTVYLEESYVSGSDYGLAIGVSAGAAIASTIWSKQNFYMATSAVARAVFNNGGTILMHEDSINRGCCFYRENDGVIIYTDGNEIYHVFEGMSIQDTLNNIPVAGCTIRVHDGTYTITDPITITQSNVTLQGDGRNTFIDGDGLATTEHGIVISGKTNVTIRNLAIQTEDGGGKVCHCIFIEDGSNNCHIKGVTIVDSDSDGIHIEGTILSDVHIDDCNIEDVDGHGIYVDMDAANYLYRGRIIDCLVASAGGSGIYLNNRADNCCIKGNYCRDNTRYGVEIAAVTSSKNILLGNQLINNTMGAILDSGVLTTVEESNKEITPPEVKRYVYMKNTSGGPLVAGNVVVFKTGVAAGDEFTTTVTLGDDHVLGIVAEAIADTAYGYVLVAGKTVVLSASNDNGNIAIGDFLTPSNTATEAVLAGALDTAFAIALEALAAAGPTPIDALLINPMTF